MKKREGEEEEEKNMTKQLLLCEKLKKWLRFLHIDIHVSHQAHTHTQNHTYIYSGITIADIKWLSIAHGYCGTDRYSICALGCDAFNHCTLQDLYFRGHYTKPWDI